jgi:cobalamin biosynthesis Co2+ chelatase CbiK
MVEAKLPDSVIIAKIRNSKSKFDTSTDGLIKLKQAGVSDAVIQVMAETVPK